MVKILSLRIFPAVPLQKIVKGYIKNIGFLKRMTETVSVSVFGRNFGFGGNFGLAEMEKTISVSVSVI